MHIGIIVCSYIVDGYELEHTNRYQQQCSSIPGTIENWDVRERM